MHAIFETGKIKLMQFARAVRNAVMLAPGILALITLWERFF